MKKTLSKEKWFLLAIVLLFIVASVIALSQKANLHVDEVYTYGLSNHPYDGNYTMSPEEGKVYSPAEEAWDEYMQVQPGHQFDYANVWKNQSEDVHPPLYYTLIHTVCSFFPQQYSIWFAGSINIAVGALTVVVVYFLMLLLSKSKKSSLLTAAFFALSAGTLSAVTFLRMYIVAMFWVALFTYLVVKAYQGWKSKLFYLFIFLVAVAGTLTHYYFLIYLLFLCLGYGIWLLVKKQFSLFVKFFLTMCLSGGAALAAFPSMLQQILAGNRGTEAFDNLQNVTFGQYLQQLGIFLNFFNQQIFGGLLPLVLLFFLVAVCLRKKRNQPVSQKTGVFLLALSSVAYYLLVSKIAAYAYDRYIFPIYPVVSVLGCYLLSYRINTLLPKVRKPAVAAGAMTVITILTFVFCPWEYLYQNSKPLLEYAQTQTETPCLYVYDASWMAQQSFYEGRNYSSVVFIQQNNLGALDSLELDTSSNLILCLMNSCNQEAVFEKLRSLYPSEITIEAKGQYFFTTTYEIVPQKK